MKRPVAWSARDAEGAKRKVRVSMRSQTLYWEFRCADQTHWDQTAKPTPEDWDELERLLVLRSKRGKRIDMLELVRKTRSDRGL